MRMRVTLESQGVELPTIPAGHFQEVHPSNARAGADGSSFLRTQPDWLRVTTGCAAFFDQLTRNLRDRLFYLLCSASAHRHNV